MKRATSKAEIDGRAEEDDLEPLPPIDGDDDDASVDDVPKGELAESDAFGLLEEGGSPELDIGETNAEEHEGSLLDDAEPVRGIAEGDIGAPNQCVQQEEPSCLVDELDDPLEDGDIAEQGDRELGDTGEEGPLGDEHLDKEELPPIAGDDD